MSTMAIAEPRTPAEQQSQPNLPNRAVVLSAQILRDAVRRETPAEQKRRAKMAKMMADAAGKAFTIALSDQILRIENPARAAQRLRDLVERLGIPSYFTTLEKALLRCGAFGAQWLPSLVMPQVTEYVRRECRHVILSAEERPLNAYLQTRRASGAGIIVNQLGEAVLGEREAGNRLEAILNRLADPRIDRVSVKISAVVSQVYVVAYEATLALFKERLRRLYDAAIKHGGARPKSVTLDMEEYRDLHLTLDAFQQVLDEKAYEKMEGGIVLQAYLPDSWPALQELTDWARARQARTGAGIRLRLVKGANLAMEQVEAARQGWPQAPYNSKAEVDANYKRMLEFATRPENIRVVRLGVASHNLFDLAYAILLGQERGVTDRVEFEMLEGMANAQAGAVQQAAGNLLVYAPIVLKKDFESAIAYLIRRLEENTAPENFLCDLFGLQEGNAAWERQKSRFLQACADAQSPTLHAGPNRTQNRLTEQPVPDTANAPFRNTPDTDFTLPQNRVWLDSIFKRWPTASIPAVPVQIGGVERPGRIAMQGRNPSKPGAVAYACSGANVADVEEALAGAVKAQPAWEKRSLAERATILRQVAAVLAKHRADAIGAMMVDAGKAVKESDPEVSEAVDFANYYARALDDAGWHDGTKPQALGVVVVTPPWNFPYAIPAGGVLAALMAGNSVILKPARETILVGWELAQQFWKAGVPKEVLQFLPAGDREAGRKLVTDDRVAAVILTGAYETAQMFRSWKPAMRLYAETSGKNALIITAAADVDLAIKDLVHSAFSHNGQKCSAASLALVEASVYDSETFRRQLKDAVESLRCGPSTEPASWITPLIHEPDENLKRALTTCDPGEEWLVEPRMIGGNPCLWSPGVKLGVKPGSWYHRTECFGPVVGVMRVADLDEAIAIQNSNDFGLTGGLHSLDEAEIAKWRASVEVGNAYINRVTTGAIVRRQPFGGWKNSAVGPGTKAGGPNYVSGFARWQQTALPMLRGKPADSVADLLARCLAVLSDDASREQLRASAESYAYWWQREFSVEHDPSQVRGEANHLRYRPRKTFVLRADESAPSPLAVMQVVVAAATCGVDLELSSPRPMAWNIPGLSWIMEDETSLAKRLSARQHGGLRLLAAPSESLLRAANEANLPVHDEPVLANGRLELLHYLREQAISETRHRHGVLRTERQT